MSIEYEATPAVEITEPVVELVDRFFRTSPKLSGGSRSRYAIRTSEEFAGPRRCAREVITCVIRPNSVYVAFRACTGVEEDLFLASLHDVLASGKVDCNFEEL